MAFPLFFKDLANINQKKENWKKRLDICNRVKVNLKTIILDFYIELTFIKMNTCVKLNRDMD